MALLLSRSSLSAVTLLSIGLTLASVSLEAREAKIARVNPFARPLVVAPDPVARSRRTESAPSSGQSVPQLRGVLQAGANSFANVGGSIVGLGESVAGLTLQSVTETTAVFVRHGRKITLEVSSTTDISVIEKDKPSASKG